MEKAPKKTSTLIAVGIILILGLGLGCTVLKYQYGLVFKKEGFVSEKEEEGADFKGYRGIPGVMVKESKKVKITKDLIEKIINNTLSTEYEDKTIRTFGADLNGDGQEELIISAFKKTFPGQFEKDGLLVVVTPTDELGRFKKIGELAFVSNFSREVGEAVGNDNRVVDIESDGISEIVLDLGSNELGYNEFYGIFKVDFEENKIAWLEVKAEYNTVRKTEFSRGNANSGPTAFELKDVDGDGWLDIEETLYPPVHESGGKETVNVYRWDGKMFVYERGL